MFLNLVQNNEGWWVALPIFHKSAAAAWAAAREMTGNVRIVQIVGEIERIGSAQDGETGL
jgi:hypothetical protein